MRRLRVVSWSILNARLSLSAVSSSTELEAVFTSTPSLRRRSMTSWLERLRSLASWKNLTFVIRLSPFARRARSHARHLARVLFRRHTLRRALGRRLDRRGLVLRRRLLGRRFLCAVIALLAASFRDGGPRLLLRLLVAGGLLGVAAVPLDLGFDRGLADLLGGLGPDGLDPAQVLGGHLGDGV